MYPPHLLAQLEVTESFGDLAPPMQIALLLGALSFATAALVSLTAFTRIIIVLSFVRRALSTTEIPPNQVILGLSFFLTLFVMAPTMEAIKQKGVDPYLAAQESEETQADFGMDDLLNVVRIEIHHFMIVHTGKNDLALFQELANQKPLDDEQVDDELDREALLGVHELAVSDSFESPSVVEQVPLKVLIPAFIISELKTAFIMGFCIYIPFLLIDLVISTVLMSLGMMMMPPVIVSTPCKLLLFVLVDGWHLISKALVSSFVA
jgi:flagellar biosynthetic protein FliP